MKAALAGSRGEEAHEQDSDEPPPPDPPSDAIRFATPRPGSRALPPPSRPSSGPAIEPLTTGVMPGGSVGPYTAELMYDGLDDRGRETRSPRPPAPVRPPRAARTPPPPSEPVSASLPDVPMPPPDTGRARPLSAPPRPSTMRPQPAARPEARPGRPSARPPSTETGAVRRLEELLTLADEPPEREDTASRGIDLLSISEAPPGQESTLDGPDDRPIVDPPVPASAPRPPVETEFHPLGGAFVAPKPSARDESLTGALVLLEEGDELAKLVAPAPAPAPVVEPTLELRPNVREPEPPPPPRSAPPEPARPAPLASFEPPAAQEDPLATRRLPKRPEAAAPAPKAAPVPEPPPLPPSAEPTVLTMLPPEPAPAADAKGSKPLDSTQLRRETYKPKPAAKEPAKEAAPDSFGSERDYREPILAWLASLVGLVVIAGGIFIALLIAIAIMGSR